MIAALSLALFAAPEVVWTAGERAPAVVVFLGERLDHGALFAAAERAIEAGTGLDVLDGPGLGLSVPALLACPAERRIACWTEVVREASLSRHVLVVGVSAPAAGRLRLQAMWIDLDAPDGEVLELPVLEAPAGALDSAFEAMGRELAGVGPPTGELVLLGAEGGATVALDGRVLGLGAARVRIRDLAAGPHQVAIDGRLVPVEVLPHGVVEVDARAPVDVGRWSLRAVGAAAVVSGVALLVTAIVFAAGEDREALCVSRTAAECPGLGLPRAGYDAEPALAVGADAINGGVPLVPIGALLLLGGAGALVGAELDGGWRIGAASAGLALGVGALALTVDR